MISGGSTSQSLQLRNYRIHRCDPLSVEGTDVTIIHRAIAVLAIVATASGVFAYESRTYYVPMSDGVRLAADVYLPEGFDSEKKYPAVLELTRYWRATIDPQTGHVQPLWNPVDKALLANGYVLVVVDVRGSGASFGHRLEEYGPTEVKDGFEIVDWV